MFSTDGYEALRRGAGVVRRGDRGLLSVTGGDRLAWLQGLLTNDVANLPMDGVCEAAYLTPQGRMITDMRVINLADRTLLDVPGSLAEALRARLDTLLFAEDAAIENVSARLLMIDVHGVTAPQLIDAARGGLQAGAAAIVRHDAFDLPGFSIIAAPSEAGTIVATLAAHGAAETTLATLDVIRVEAGRPAFLIDMDEHTIPLEAGIEDRVISFTKGCYVGQEVIVRVMHRGGGRVAKKLVGFSLATSEVPPAGSTVHSGGRQIGRVTSSAWSPDLQRAIALGYVHRDFVSPATAVRISAPAGDLEAVVAALPFMAAAPAAP